MRARIITRIAAGAVSATMLTGLGLGVASAPAASASITPAATASVRLPVADGNGGARVRPRGFSFQDSGLTHMHWNRWTVTFAAGAGRYEATAGPGHTVNLAAKVTLSRVRNHKFTAMKIITYRHGHRVGSARLSDHHGYWTYA